MNEKEYTTISISDNLRTVSVTSHKEGLNIEQFRELLKDACKASGWLEIQVLDIFNELNEDLPEHQLYLKNRCSWDAFINQDL
jgi:hypothetical protein